MENDDRTVTQISRPSSVIGNVNLDDDELWKKDASDIVSVLVGVLTSERSDIIRLLGNLGQAIIHHDKEGLLNQFISEIKQLREKGELSSLGTPPVKQSFFEILGYIDKWEVPEEDVLDSLKKIFWEIENEDKSADLNKYELIKKCVQLTSVDLNVLRAIYILRDGERYIPLEIEVVRQNTPYDFGGLIRESEYRLVRLDLLRQNDGVNKDSSLHFEPTDMGISLIQIIFDEKE